MLKLAKYTDDSQSLRDLDDAAFLRRKLEPTTELDFTGVNEVSVEFLKVLLEGQDPATFIDRLHGLTPVIEEALDTLLQELEPTFAARPATKTPPRPEPPAVKPKARPKAKLVMAGTLQVNEARFTPSRLMETLRKTLREYLESAYPLSEPALIRARRELLETAEDRRLLVQEPFVEGTPRYMASDVGYEGLELPHDLGNFLSKLTTLRQEHDPKRTLLFPGLYAHQAEAFKAYLGEGRDLIVATGTGSGKTECFLVPMIAGLYDEAKRRPESFKQRAVRALILYPMNALVNDQLARLRLLVGDSGFAQQFKALESRHPVFGMYTGRTPYAGHREAQKDGNRVAPLVEYYLGLDQEVADQLKKLGRYPAKDLERFLAADLAVPADGKKRAQNHWNKRLQTQPDDRELLTRHEMIATEGGASPDILITNYSMLEYMLMRPFERPIFDETRAWLEEEGSQFLLVIDEAHMYHGAKGAEVAFLIRRLLDRLGIIGKPEKLRVIVTSASLGSETNAPILARAFAADLSGKEPASFQVVTGRREEPPAAACRQGNPMEAQALAAFDLKILHQTQGNLPELIAQLDHLLGEIGAPQLEIDRGACDEAEVFTALHRSLKGHGLMLQLTRETCQGAIALGGLAERVFGPATDKDIAVRATEVLLSLGAIAKPASDEPGLLPTRIHMLLRALNGLYACLNPECPGREPNPGERASWGKLFVTPRSHCDACQSRVFELMSCRDCGTAYGKAYVPTDRQDLVGLDYLWGEGEENLQPIQLLPVPPQSREGVEEIRVQLSTGAVTDPGAAVQSGEVRSLFLAYDADQGKRLREFSRCPICQPPSARSVRIDDFRTKGEQAFTALVEAQFAEQPPQSTDVTLVNQGRKVLVFSDGRQKAARLAPALESSHLRDVFRQLVMLGVRNLEELGLPGALRDLYPAVVSQAVKRGVDLFPDDPDSPNWHAHCHIYSAMNLDLAQMLKMHHFQPDLGFLKLIFEELTDRYVSLQAIGAARVKFDPAFDQILFSGFPAVGLNSDEQEILLRQWIRVQLERRSLLPLGATQFKLGDGHLRPESIEPGKRSNWLPPRFEAYLLELFKGNTADVDAIDRWLNELARRHGRMLFNYVDNRYYLQLGSLHLENWTQKPWYRCTRCSRLYPETIRNLCVDCLGSLEDAKRDDTVFGAKAGYYRHKVERALAEEGTEPFGLLTKEHSAQLASPSDEGEAYQRTEEYELRFQNIRVADKPPIDVLSCTTTMEVGIDIGALTGVALRNVPPQVANYQQRAGRAGRRGRSLASVITYAHGGTHDAHYFAHPDEIITGKIKAPALYIQNLKVLERHINAFLLQRFFHENAPVDKTRYQLFEALGTVEEFLKPSGALGLDKLEAWLQQNEPRLKRDLRAWVPGQSHGQNQGVSTAPAIDGAISQLLKCLQEALPIDAYAGRDQLGETERAALDLELAENLLQKLIEQAVLPRYAFPTDLVTLWVPTKRALSQRGKPREFKYTPQRDLQIALSEYAPGGELTIDGYRIKPAALFTPYAASLDLMLQGARSYVLCNRCQFVAIDDAAKAMSICPNCQSTELFKREFIRPQGFTTNVNDDLEREGNRGATAQRGGFATPARIEPPTVSHWDQTYYEERLKVHAAPRDLVTVNKGIKDVGFLVCPKCGLTEPPPIPGMRMASSFRKGKNASPTHVNPLSEGLRCDGVPNSEPYFLGHTFRTDVLLMRLFLDAPLRCSSSTTAGKKALTTLIEAMALAASRALQIEEGELAGNWSPVPGSGDRQVDLYLYDLLPGGAGYTLEVKANLDLVLQETRRLLSACHCESSCYRCIRHYGNQFRHGLLDRHLALALLEVVLEKKEPNLGQLDYSARLGALADLLTLKGIKVQQGQLTPGGEQIPLVIEGARGTPIWTELHHPLVNPDEWDGPLGQEGELSAVPVIPLDAHSLVYDLPNVLNQIAHACGMKG